MEDLVCAGNVNWMYIDNTWDYWLFSLRWSLFGCLLLFKEKMIIVDVSLHLFSVCKISSSALRLVCVWRRVWFQSSFNRNRSWLILMSSENTNFVCGSFVFTGNIGVWGLVRLYHASTRTHFELKPWLPQNPVLFKIRNFNTIFLQTGFLLLKTSFKPVSILLAFIEFEF